MNHRERRGHRGKSTGLTENAKDTKKEVDFDPDSDGDYDFEAHRCPADRRDLRRRRNGREGDFEARLSAGKARIL